MPVPGASTASALVVCVATLSGWCLWQQNCGQDDLVSPSALEIVEKGEIPQPMQDASEAAPQALRFQNHSLQPSAMGMSKQWSKSLLSRDFVTIASSSHVSMEKAFEFFAVANLSLEKLYPSRFADFEEVVTPLSTVKFRTLQRDQSSSHGIMQKAFEVPIVANSSIDMFHIARCNDFNEEIANPFGTKESRTFAENQPHSTMPTVHMQKQDTILGTSSLMRLLGAALVLDMLACSLLFVCAMAAWHGWSSKSSTPAFQDSHEAARTFVKPMFVQPPTPSHCDGTEPIFDTSPLTESLDGLQAQASAIAIDSLHAKSRAAFIESLHAAAGSSDDDLQARISTIVSSHAEHRKQCEECSVQHHASMALNAAREREQIRQLGACQPMDWADHASPSPAKSMSNIELAYCAHVALSAAKERTTPAKSPAAVWDAYAENDVELCQLHLGACDDNDVVTRQLSFADDADEQQVKTFEPELQELAIETTEEGLAAELAQAAAAELAACLAESDVAAEKLGVSAAEKFGDAKEAQGLPFDPSQIPSPTRNRARKKQLFAASPSVADAEGSELAKKLQSRRDVVDTEGTTWQKLPEAVVTDASNIDVWKSSEQGWPRQADASNIDVWKSSEQGWPSWNEVQQTRMEGTQTSSEGHNSTKRRPSQRDFSSPGREAAVGRMLQSSATPQKHNGEKLQGGKRNLVNATTPQEKEVAMRRAAAFEAWGVSSPAPAPRTDSFMYQ